MQSTKELTAPLLPPTSKPGNRRLAGASNQPVCLGADVWEGNNLVRATTGCKGQQEL